LLQVKIAKRLNSFVLNKELKVKGGEIITLFGPSGSGKSITLKSIAGLVSPDKGLIQLNDKVLFDSEAHINLKPQERNLGYVPQSYGLFPHMSVLENVSFGIKEQNKDIKKSMALEMLMKFDINSIANMYPNEISGGQKQRVAIARALSGNPEVLLLDEPFSAIDINLRKIVRAEIKFFLDQCKIPIVLVTHDYDDVKVLGTKLVKAIEKLVQRIVIMCH